mmetsp:Transcript_2017/g.4373  ORF Transcript_2017/g.4373 Transcript_2017/m.4373 type:complete len:150 (+) Transcript_2017:158-607(+)
MAMLVAMATSVAMVKLKSRTNTSRNFYHVTDFIPRPFPFFPDRIPARIEYPQAIFMASVDGSDSDNSNGKTETKREHVPQLPPGHGFHLLTVQNLIPATPKSSTATSVVSVNGNGSSDGRPENTSKREHEPEPQPKKRRVCHGFSSDLC